MYQAGFPIPTLKNIDAPKKAEASKTEASVVEEKIDFSNVKVEPLFEELVDFETFSKSDFRAVKVLDCTAVPKSKKPLLLDFTEKIATVTEVIAG